MFDILTEEQRDFAKSIDDFCAREVGGVEKRRELTTEGGTHSPHIYSKRAELGWLGLTVPEEYGGSDAGPDRRHRPHPHHGRRVPEVRDRGAA